MRGDDSQFFSHLSFVIPIPVADRSETNWDCRREMERYFPIEPGNREEWLLPFFIPFPKPSRGKSTELVYQNELNGKFRSNRSECSKWIISRVVPSTRSDGTETDLSI